MPCKAVLPHRATSSALGLTATPVASCTPAGNEAIQSFAAERLRTVMDATNASSIHTLHLRAGSQACSSSPDKKDSFGIPSGQVSLAWSTAWQQLCPDSSDLSTLVAPVSGVPVTFRLARCIDVQVNLVLTKLNIITSVTL
jgi:hypothetical protein